MRAKKTIQIEYIKNLINKELTKIEFEPTTEQKDILVSLIEKILHDTNNYKGFMFRNNEDTKFMSNGYFSRKYF